ncbi:hypothetical protein VNO78_33701 [Psophocarpus tetragonolobus]|uniref:Calcium-transporting ATPase n=1 Tax=Psophocarpus tetragonolobus TaxID=3891 RepID=A0AAN9P1M7_PSOTE
MSKSFSPDLLFFEKVVLKASNTKTASKQRWHFAFVTIYCSRAIMSFSTLNKTHKTKAKASPTPTPTPSFTVIDLTFLNPQHHSFAIDKTSLTNIAIERDLQKLVILGGVQGVASILETNVEYGIEGDADAAAAEDITRRKQVFGSNTYWKPSKGFFHFVGQAFKNVPIFILLVFAAASLVCGIAVDGIKQGWYNGGSYFLAVFIVISLSSISNFRQNKQVGKLFQRINDKQIDVVRSGRRQHVPITEIVVGDVIWLKNGDQVPADGILIEGHSLKVVEYSRMIGCIDVTREQHPFLYSGNYVVDGYAKMLVTSVGMNTKLGQRMSSRSHHIQEKTPLQKRLVMLGLAVNIVVLIVLSVGHLARASNDEKVRDSNGSRSKFDDIVKTVLGIVSDAVTIVGFTLPEVLPLAVTLTLAYSMKRMMTDQAMVKNHSVCEKMGSVTTICTDKTGTLTLNQMKVTKFWLGLEPVLESAYTSVASSVLQLLQEGVALNTDGTVQKSNNSCSEFEFSGSPTEKAILSWGVQELNMEMEQLTRNCSIIHVETFNSEKKRSGVLLRRKADNTANAHWKGAAEMVLKVCSRYYDASGIVQDLDEDSILRFEHIIQGMAASSLRCIAFAHVQVAEEELGGDEQGNIMVKDNGLTLLGLAGIKDPCCPKVKQEVEACQHAGVNVKMVTGDNVFTAKAIAIECGILQPNQDIIGAVIEGEEFRNYTPEERLEKVDKICVMARSSPSDKLLMVQCLKQKGHVVAVTGDSTNDEATLVEADIGLSMGIQGTEVAKESSDIVILNDNFASVVTVLKWGRCVDNSIQKFIQFKFTVTVAALAINFVAAVSAGKEPLTAVQLLWVNLIMDTLGALALATEKPTMELMDQPPVGRTKPLITNVMWRNLLAQALYQIAVLLTLLLKGESIFGVTSGVNDTLVFNTFVLCNVFNEFNARDINKKNVFKGIHRSKLFLGIIVITIILQVMMVEFLNKFADAERLNWMQWVICIGLASVTLPIGWVGKLIPVPVKHCSIFEYEL